MTLTAMIASWLGTLRPTDAEVDTDTEKQQPQRSFVPTKPLCETDMILIDMLNSAGINEVCYCISDPDQKDCPIAFASDGFCGYTGYSATEIEGQNCRFLQGPDTDAKDVTCIRQAVERYTSATKNNSNNNATASTEAGASSSASESQEALLQDPVSVNLLNYRKDGTSFCNEFFLAPLRDSNKKLQYLIGVQCPVKQLGPGQAPSNPGYVPYECLHASTCDSVWIDLHVLNCVSTDAVITNSHSIPCLSAFYFFEILYRRWVYTQGNHIVS
jgi:hypothetical protein